MIAVITGATGLVGHALIQKLIDDHTVTGIISVSRRSLEIQSEKITEVLLEDFTNLSLVGAKLKGDVYFCCLGTTIKTAGSQENFKKIDHHSVLQFAKIAKRHHAQSFIVVSAEGANARSRFFYNRVKGEMERDLEQLSLQRLVIMHPSLLIGERKEFRLMERVAIKVMKKISPVIPPQFKKIAMTDVNVLAERMLAESKLKKSGLTIVSAKKI